MVAEMELSSEQSKPAQLVTSKKGGLRTMPCIISNEALEKVASFGLHANMILYLTSEYHMEAATGASILFLWSAMSSFTPIIGAFLSDSHLGRFRVIALGTVVSLLGEIVLWLTAVFPQARPVHCDDPSKEKCVSANTAQVMLLFASFGLMSIGSGGIRPCSLAFGADQLDKPDSPKNEKVLQSFFNWYYASVGVSVMFAVTVIVYVQVQLGWVVGFGVPVGLMLLSGLLFLLGSSLYVRVPPNKNLSAGLVQAIAAAWKNRHLALPPKNFDAWHSPKGSKFAIPTDNLRYLNKACMIRSPEDIGPDGLAKDPWSLCTVRQVEELKALIRILPIWSSGIMIGVTIAQHAFPVLLANTMDRHFLGKIKIPAASFSLFGILTLTIWVVIYDRILVPLVSKYTKRPRGFSFKQRIGAGLVISCLATAAAAEVERQRRKTAIQEGFLSNPEGVVSMSANWLVLQHCLTGLAEALNAIGQLEFYYSQFPKSMSSIAVALLSLGFGFGSLVGSLVVSIVDDVTKKDGVSWVSSNVNMGHYDYYYWLLTAMSVVNVFYFLLCSWLYGHCEDKKNWDEGEGTKEMEDLSKSREYTVIFPA
ncbi:hypothetical protein ACE6H2_025339 [Prunus campanulata]